MIYSCSYIVPPPPGDKKENFEHVGDGIWESLEGGRRVRGVWEEGGGGGWRMILGLGRGGKGVWVL